MSFLSIQRNSTGTPWEDLVCDVFDRVLKSPLGSIVRPQPGRSAAVWGHEMGALFHKVPLTVCKFSSLVSFEINDWFFEL